MEIFVIDIDKQQKTNNANINDIDIIKSIASSPKSPLYNLRDCQYSIENNTISINNFSHLHTIEHHIFSEQNNYNNLKEINYFFLTTICQKILYGYLGKHILISTNKNPHKFELSWNDNNAPIIIDQLITNNYCINDDLKYIQVNINDNLIVTLTNFQMFDKKPQTHNNTITNFVKIIESNGRIISKSKAKEFYITVNVTMEVGPKIIKKYKAIKKERMK